ncbi:DEAD/DEAH box helicase [Embleya sp. MST-111070]|uniref:DEAD/DEAH box helicase n=1 Tax=Embleya sp. MST-111070 TaxID=3398231 RepID=UPI003F73AF8E
MTSPTDDEAVQRCPGTTARGLQCRALVPIANGWCAAHRPPEAGPAPVRPAPFRGRLSKKALEENRQRVRATVACPYCDAPVGQPCVGVDGAERVSNHNERRHLALRADATAPVTAGGPPAPPAEHPHGSTESDSTVAGIVARRWRATLATSGLAARMNEPGWSYEGRVEFRCPMCAGVTHTLRKPYVDPKGETRRYIAVVCPSCPAASTLRELGISSRDLMKQATPPATATPAEPHPAADPHVRVPGPRGDHADAAVVPVRGTHVPPARRIDRPGVWPADLPSHAPAETRRLYWRKVTDPLWRLPEHVAPDTDVRVILPEGDEYAPLRAHLDARGAQSRSVPYWVEDETVGTVDTHGTLVELAARPAVFAPSVTDGEERPPVLGPGAHAARDVFEAVWESLTPQDPENVPEPAPVAELVPAAWARLLPHPTFNPAQLQAVPVVLDDTVGHVLIVAPTGAGKTPIGMVAALHTHERGRKAVWLVPQRSLTDELDRDLEAWRRHGIRVARLSGEYATDARAIRDADVWVSTTEKFEAICRTASLRDVLAEVGCLIVDEIHLLGDPVRGPVLEALLARVRDVAHQVRIVGLSATVSNADDIGHWLGAALVRVSWRPTRLVWQLPMIPLAADRPTRQLARTRVATRLTETVTRDGGSVLVFCGSKRNVRTTALAIAASRGQPTTGIDVDDTDRVHDLCRNAGVGLHYRDWPHKHDAERAFRARDIDVLVATSTVAAGVNLPARAVVVRDTQVGLDRVEVSMVQQMFGRAGRVGTGETEGSAYLVTEESERPIWQARLAAGYTVRSQIRNSLPDQVLAEIVQERVRTVREADAWWVQTLAHHQDGEDPDLLGDAIDFLIEGEFLHREPGPRGDDALAATDLGRLTCRMMVAATTADRLRRAVTAMPVPRTADDAEHLLITLAAILLPGLEQAPTNERAEVAVLRVLHARGFVEDLGAWAPPRTGLASKPSLEPGDLAKAALMLVAASPHVFRKPSRTVAGIPTDNLTPVLEEAERYLAWLGAQGTCATLHPWAVVTAADLGRRVRWRSLGPGRGAGRLLWMCEQMATPLHATRGVPDMWTAATSRGITAPDWPSGRAPNGCRLEPDQYTALLNARTSHTVLESTPTGAIVTTAPMGAFVHLWDGAAFTTHIHTGEATELRYPHPRDDDPSAGRRGAAVCTRRGDHTGTGWLIAYRATT